AGDLPSRVGRVTADPPRGVRVTPRRDPQPQPAIAMPGHPAQGRLRPPADHDRHRRRGRREDADPVQREEVTGHRDLAAGEQRASPLRRPGGAGSPPRPRAPPGPPPPTPAPNSSLPGASAASEATCRATGTGCRSGSRYTAVCTVTRRDITASAVAFTSPS